jgi:prepilin-type N-terminal cleavage/methylation domain-containing protein
MTHHTRPIKTASHGFTLVETLVAITVLLMVIIGPISAAQKGIQRAYYANEQLSAVFIGQEAIEAVRQYRDDQALAVWESGGRTWNWEADTSCKFADCPFTPTVEKDGVTFTRAVGVQDIDGSSRSVTVTVTWKNRSLFGEEDRTVILQTYLYDHYQRFE